MLRSDLKAQEIGRAMDRLQRKRSGSQTTHLHQTCCVLEKPLATSPPSQERHIIPYRNGFLQLFELRRKTMKGGRKEGKKRLVQYTLLKCTTNKRQLFVSLAPYRNMTTLQF